MPNGLTDAFHAIKQDVASGTSSLKLPGALVSAPRINTVQLSHGRLVQHAAEGRMDAPFTCEWRACRCYPAATEILN